MSQFNDHLQKYLQFREDLQRKNASEDMIRASFLDFLSKAFPDIQTEEVDLEKTIKLPMRVPGAIVRHGFMDAVYGDLVFEFKQKLDKFSRSKG